MNNDFLEISLPLELAYGASGGPEFNTNIITSFNGKEQRNINWQMPKFHYNLNPTRLTDLQMQELYNFFQLVKGRALGFRFRDLVNYSVANHAQTITNGISTKLQLKTIYQFGNQNLTRIISKPVQNSLNIYFDNILTNEFKCDYTTGIVTFNQPPPRNTTITADFEYDIPVRFDIDYINISLESFGCYSTNSISLIEIR